MTKMLEPVCSQAAKAAAEAAAKAAARSAARGNVSKQEKAHNLTKAAHSFNAVTIMASRRCVLVPAYRPAFNDLGRLVSGVQDLSLDMETVRLFAILSNSNEVADFRREYVQQSAALSFLALDGLLHRHTSANVTTMQRLQRMFGRGCLEQRRTVPSIKKFVGLAELHRAGCEYAWILDSESVPLRRFRFATIFDENEANPRILATNKSHPLVRGSARHNLHVRCAAAGLGVRLPSSRTVFRTVDYWVWSLKTVMDLMAHVSFVHREPFLHRFLRHPASEAFYYGLYVQLIAPSNALALSTVNPTIVRIPEVLIEHDLAPARALFTDELAPNIWACDKIGKQLWTKGQTERILSGPLKWVHGWRFDHLGRCQPSDRSSARDLLATSPSVLWATSNFRDQVPLPPPDS